MIYRIFSDFMSAPKEFSAGNDVKSNCVYMSNGLDYKLIYSNALDIPYAKQAYPGLVDLNWGGMAFGRQAIKIGNLFFFCTPFRPLIFWL